MVEVTKIPQKADERGKLRYLAARMTEASTYAGLSTIVAVFVMLGLFPQAEVAPLVKGLTLAGEGLGTLLGVVAFLVPEKR